MGNVAFIIIYNHQFNKNIDIIEDIYKDRFSNIFHLMPFYRGNKENVIPVYDNSFFFQNYVAQGYKFFFRDKFEHYIFIGDDLIINPQINENNYLYHFNLTNSTSFIPNFLSLHELKGKWWSKVPTVEKNILLVGNWWERVIYAFNFNIKQSGLEIENQLPSYSNAQNCFKEHNLDLKPLTFNHIWKPPISLKNFFSSIFHNKFNFFKYLKWGLIRKKIMLSYPLVASYSDIFIVDSKTIKNFCHYCGVFASARLFVEIAIPTSLVLSAKEISTEKNTILKGGALWKNVDSNLINRYESMSLTEFFNDFPCDKLYLHPIKLSKLNK